MNIKSINKMNIDIKDIDKYPSLIQNELQTLLKEKESLFKNLIKQSEELLEEKYVYIEDKYMYFHSEVNSLIPDFKKYNNLKYMSAIGIPIKSLQQSDYPKFKYIMKTDNEFINESGIIYYDELLKIMDDECNIRDWNITRDSIYSTYVCNYKKNSNNSNVQDYYSAIMSKNFKKDIGGVCHNMNGWYPSGMYHFYYIPIYRLHKNKSINNIKQILNMWIENDLVPRDLDENNKEFLKSLIRNYKKDSLLLSYSNENSEFYNNIDFKVEDIAKKLTEDENLSFEINDVIFSYENAKKSLVQKNHGKVNDIMESDFAKSFLDCESIRADIESYDKKILTDVNRGHWDLYSEEEVNEDEFYIDFSPNLMARNPHLDVKNNGIVGIDFGTKSTVVVFQEDNAHILPMRVGSGKLSKDIDVSHYENPTVMEFKNLENFLKDYNEKSGRPNTKWNDIAISHTASASLMESSNSNNYYSFFNELKQWAGTKNKNIKIKDSNGNERILKSYLDIDENDFDPIEIYAYYLGLYINNMHNGIYIKYILSFPVTYEKSIRDKVIESFNAGIKKSIPEVILNDESVMKKFKVQAGASEPAAYAICALEEYDFEIEDGKSIRYGVFDFGGGTTDFDFGVWREAEGKDARRFDYVLEHFGAGGDRYLGGENILELLAFEVFKSNEAILRKENISFTLPPECLKFAGCEVLLSDSQEARLNTKKLMSKLRPFWEKHEGWEEQFQSGTISVDLFNKNGEYRTNFDLSIDVEKLQEIVKKRIEKGIINFFEALKLSFKDNSGDEDLKEIKILLAGNSSKCEIVKDLFLQYIEKETKAINEEFKLNDEYFKIYPPLGSEESYKIIKENNVDFDKDDMCKPTGKTGVAFGLIKSRSGGKIKVIDKNVIEKEIKFKYYLGYEKKGKFNVLLDRDIAYGKWYEFIEADYEDFEIYYTTLAEATSNKVDILKVSRYNVGLDETFEDANVYIRAISPTVLEYVVAEEDDLEDGTYLSEIVKVDLG